MYNSLIHILPVLSILIIKLFCKWDNAPFKIFYKAIFRILCHWIGHFILIETKKNIFIYRDINIKSVKNSTLNGFLFKRCISNLRKICLIYGKMFVDHAKYA